MARRSQSPRRAHWSPRAVPRHPEPRLPDQGRVPPRFVSPSARRQRCV